MHKPLYESNRVFHVPVFEYVAGDDNPEIIGPCVVISDLDEHNDEASWQFVTLCRDCVSWDADGRSLSGQHGCSKWLITTPPGFFCAGGEPCTRG